MRTIVCFLAPFALATTLAIPAGATTTPPKTTTPAPTTAMPQKALQKESPQLASVNAQVVRIHGDDVAAVVNGSLVELRAYPSTRIQGRASTGIENVHGRLALFAPGDVVSASIARKGGMNELASIERVSSGSGQAVKNASFAPKTFEGRVCHIAGRDLFLDVNGVAVKLVVNGSTKLNGAKAKVGERTDKRLERAFKMGDDVSAYTLPDRTKNEAVYLAKK